MARELSLSVFQGAGLSITFTAVSLGDMTGWLAHSQVRDADTRAILADLHIGSGLVLHGPQSQIVWTVTGVQTAAFPLTGAIFDLFAEPPSGQPIRFGGGTIAVLEPVTIPAIA